MSNRGSAEGTTRSARDCTGPEFTDRSLKGYKFAVDDMTVYEKRGEVMVERQSVERYGLPQYYNAIISAFIQ